MEQFLAALNGAFGVLVIGLVLGAGLPTLFALGLRSLAWGTGGDALLDGPDEDRPVHPVGRAVAYATFAVVILLVLAGIGYITAHGLGWTITFNGVVPVITHK
jgi:hypothetical protein